MLTKAPFITVSLLAVIVCSAAAAEHKITQKDLQFSHTEISIKVGDTVVFANEDSVNHNVFSASENFEFDSMMQEVGKSSSVRFTKVGVFDIRCAIHPKMKLKVTVTR